MPNQYVSLPEFKSWMNISDATNDAELERAIDAATQWIENETHRKFVLDAADVTKVYYANEDGTVDFADLVTVTSIKVDTAGDWTYGTTLATTDYELLPANGPRYDRVRIRPTSSRSFQFGLGRRVQIVGKFGYIEGGSTPTTGSAPPAVKQACLLQATRFFERRNAPFGILSATDLGQFERLSAKDPDVVELLKPYVASSPLAGWVVV